MAKYLDKIGLSYFWSLIKPKFQDAETIGQYFWPDSDGVHVTQVAKDDWNDSTSQNYHSGHNSLWDSLGMRFRNGLNNLMTVFSTGTTIYDGQGNSADNVLAEFTSDHVRIGGNPELIADALGLGISEDDVSSVTMQQVICSLSQPEATFTGTNTSATASSNNWTISYMNNVMGGTTAIYDYITFHNGVITVLKDCLLELSGSAYWNSGPVGQYGFGFFIGSSTVNSGTERSVFNYKANASGQFNVIMPPLCQPCSAGTQIAVGRYSIKDSVYRNGTNMSFVTIRVVQDRSS